MRTLDPISEKTLYSHLTRSIAPRDVFLQLLFETGARVSETLTLGLKDLSPAGTLQIAPLKGSLPRQVQLSANLTTKLRHLPPARWAAALSPAGYQPTLASERRALCRHFHLTTENLFGQRLNLHTLRHSAFTRLYVATKDILLVKNWAGHGSINSTLVYVHHEQRREANAANQHLLKSFGEGAE